MADTPDTLSRTDRLAEIQARYSNERKVKVQVYEDIHFLLGEVARLTAALDEQERQVQKLQSGPRASEASRSSEPPS